MARVMIVTSFKGGVGKSTVSANLAAALTSLGKTVLLIDCDFRMRSLDLILGCENHILCDLSDYFLHGAPLEKILIAPENNPSLVLAPAPYEYEGGLTPENWDALLLSASDLLGFDYIIVDTPGEAHGNLEILSRGCDTALVVATSGATSIRAAEKTASVLASFGVNERLLVINMFEERDRESEEPSIVEIIDRTSVPLVGVVPFDRRLSEKQDHGALLDFSGKKMPDISRAFYNLASRIDGKNLPLFTGFRKSRRKYLS